MPSRFGPQTDHFGTLTAAGEGVLEQLSGSEEKFEKSVSAPTDENGDPVEQTVYGHAATMKTVTDEFLVLPGQTLDLSNLALGEVGVGEVVTGLKLTTDPSGNPKLSVTGRVGCIAVTAPTGKLNTWTLPSITVSGKCVAQPLAGEAAGANCRLIATEVDFQIQFIEEMDGVGVPCVHGVQGGTGSLTATIRGITATPSWTAPTATGWVETKAPGDDGPQSDYPTGTGTASIILARDDEV